MRQARICIARVAISVVLGLTMARTASGQEGQWRVAKISGEAWISGDKVIAASTSEKGLVRAGDSIRTGRNGRVLLTRGVESILVSPNSAITLPADSQSGRSTVIQQAGTILLDVEKKNVQHFEVETPYLAAVVKGTRFRVTLEDARARVDVVRGRVQVDDFKTGASALVLPGQSANLRMNAQEGLQLTGRGRFGPIEHGMPRAPRVAPLVVPPAGLGPAPGAMPLQPAGGNGQGGATPASPSGLMRAGNGASRIAAPIGQVTLDVSAATNGVARSGMGAPVPQQGRATIWGTADLNPGTDLGKNKATNGGNPTGTAEASLGTVGAARASSASTDAAPAAASPVAAAGAAVAAIGGGRGPGAAGGGGRPTTGPGREAPGSGGPGVDGPNATRPGAGGPGNGGPGNGGPGMGRPGPAGRGEGGPGIGGPEAAGPGTRGPGAGGPNAGGPDSGGPGGGRSGAGGPGGGPGAGGPGAGGPGAGGPGGGGPGVSGPGAGGPGAGGPGTGGPGRGGPGAGGPGMGGPGMGGPGMGGPGPAGLRPRG